MRKRVAHWLLRLYPRAWRGRYEDEVRALLDQHRVTLRTLLNLLREALAARRLPAPRPHQTERSDGEPVAAGLMGGRMSAGVLLLTLGGTWRQHRATLLLRGLALALPVTYLVLSGRVMYAAAEQRIGGTSVLGCLHGQGAPGLCRRLIDDFHVAWTDGANGEKTMWLLPLLAGIALGLPLAVHPGLPGLRRVVPLRRTRWGRLLRLLLHGCAIVLVVAALRLLMAWRADPFVPLAVMGRGSWAFDYVGLVPLAYLAYALALALSSGVLLGTPGRALAATLVGFIGLRLPIERSARPYFQPPLSVTWDPAAAVAPRGLPHPLGADWTLFDGYVDKAGHAVWWPQVYAACPTNMSLDAGARLPVSTWPPCPDAHRLGWLRQVTWQPQARFWTFQHIESALFFGLAAVLLGLALWWVGTRRPPLGVPRSLMRCLKVLYRAGVAVGIWIPPQLPEQR
jgi:hypothetical protein